MKLKYAVVLVVHAAASLALQGDVEIPARGRDVADLPGLPETQVPSAIAFPLTSPTIFMFS